MNNHWWQKIRCNSKIEKGKFSLQRSEAVLHNGCTLTGVARVVIGDWVVKEIQLSIVVVLWEEYHFETKTKRLILFFERIPFLVQPIPKFEWKKNKVRGGRSSEKSDNWATLDETAVAITTGENWVICTLTRLVVRFSKTTDHEKHLIDIARKFRELGILGAVSLVSAAMFCSRANEV